MPELILGTVLPEVAKNFGQYAFVSAREIEHGRFRALFAGSFGLRCRMVEFVQEHLAISIQQSAKTKSNSKGKTKGRRERHTGTLRQLRP